MKLVVTCLTIACCMLGCSETKTDKYEIEREKLVAAKARWEKVKTPDVKGYTYISTMCCPHLHGDSSLITVKDDTLFSVTELRDRTEIDQGISFCRTIDQWFEWIDKKIDERPYVLEIAYDEVTGLPIELLYDGDAYVWDDELSMRNHSLSLL